MHSISIRHNFEAAHRLPHLPGKCQSIHGHSFWAEVTIGTDVRLPDDGILLEYGQIKSYVRQWIDSRWDHGILLGRDDPLCAHGADWLLDNLGKGYIFRGERGLWPTVEVLAWHLGGVIQDHCRNLNRALDRGDRPHLVCESVTIRETHVNAATWINPEAS